MKSEQYSLLVTNKQYAAIDAIRGMGDAAHSMRMCAEMKTDGWVLKGPEKAFEEMLSDLYMEVDERMCPKKNLHLLVQVIERIEELFPHEDIL
jgi:hypothetical protein